MSEKLRAEHPGKCSFPSYRCTSFSMCSECRELYEKGRAGGLDGPCGSGSPLRTGDLARTRALRQVIRAVFRGRCSGGSDGHEAHVRRAGSCLVFQVEYPADAFRMRSGLHVLEDTK